jgi:hypothetical protein
MDKSNLSVHYPHGDAQVPGEGVNPVHDRAGDEVEAFGVAGFVLVRQEGRSFG